MDINLEKIIVFGVGKVGKATLPTLKKNYQISFLADNDEKKWGTNFEGFEIKNPKEIKNSNCSVVITSENYVAQIVQQLRNMGIDEKRIFLCHTSYRMWANAQPEYDIYPLLTENIRDTKIELIQYDLLHTQEYTSEKKKIMIFAAFYSVYTKQLIENLFKRSMDIEFSLITNAPESKDLISLSCLKHIYYFQTMADLKAILNHIPIYDVMQLLWIEWEWAYFYHLIRKKTKRLNLNVGGSDFYRTQGEEREFRRKLIAIADYVTAETEGTVQEFKDYYGQDVQQKIGLLPFGIEVLDYISQNRENSKDEIKRKFKIPTDKLVVTCGHNAKEEHQHLTLIDVLGRVSKDIKQKIVCVFPMTYPKGRRSYIGKVKEALEKVELNYVILTDFMDFQGMAEYALISDIMIHIQTTDQLSSTMLEEMYAGSIIIAGRWLPYQSLHEMGLYFLDVDGILGVTHTLEDVVMNINMHRERCKGNPEIVWKHSSWDILASKWHALWE